MPISAKVVLFLCTGNYYRSRFAEELFNHHAPRLDLGWRATSRGLALERGTKNHGPLSHFTKAALQDRSIVPSGLVRHPVACGVADLELADLVVALKEAEHRPLLRDRFPGWQDRVSYWHVDDIEDAAPSHALALIEDRMLHLLQQLLTGGP